MPEINIIVKAKDEASRVIEQIGEKFAGLDAKTVALMSGGVVAIVGMGAAVGKLAYDAAEVEPVKRTFEDLTESIGTTAEEMLDELRPAAMGTVSDIDLMRAANKLMMMGLAESKEEAAELTRLAVGLGTAMGVDALTGLESFTLMLANQSILRMDTFGLSSGAAREEINKLVDEGLSREEAFKLVVLDQGNKRLQDLGDLSDTAFVKLGTMQAGFGNVKEELGTALLPTLNRLIDDALIPIVDKLEDLMPILEEDLPAAITPAVDALIAMAGAIEPIVKALKWIDEHRAAIDQIARIGKIITEIGMPGLSFIEMLRRGEITLPGGINPEEIGYQVGQRVGQTLGTSSTTNINVYGTPGLESAVRDIVNQEGRHTVGSIAGP